jgi:HEAT repeat protein
MSNFGVAAIDPLLSLLAAENPENDEQDWELLWFVARILGNFNDPSVIPALVNLLVETAEHSEVASMAAMSLANYGAAAVGPLSALLSNDATRLLAVQALVQIRHSDVVAPLLSLVNDPSPTIRAAAIESLGHFYDPAVSVALLAALDDLNPLVRKAAVVGLGIQARHFNQHFNQLELTEHLKRRLWDFNLEVCNQAAIALGRVGTEAAADALFAVLQSAHTPLSLQIGAVRALAWIDTGYALKLLQAFLHGSESADQSHSPKPSKEMNLSLQPQFSVQQEIITLLGRVESTESKHQAVQILLSLLQLDQAWMQTPQSRQTLALSLGQLGLPAALDALIVLLADPNASVQLHAIAALKQLNSEQAYERLQSLAVNQSTDPQLQTGVTLALQEWQG